MAFSGQILIDEVDYYAQLTGELTVSIEEGTARLASFVLDPFPGAIDPYLWIGKPVVINYIDGATDLLFTGIVHTVDYDIDAGTTKFTCTDNLQEAFELVARPAVDTLINVGTWSDKIFRSARDNWDYAQQKMSTYPGSLDKSPSGSLRVTAWAAKTVADYTYTAANIDSGSLKIDQLAERRSIINSVKIKYTSVFQGLRQRERRLQWDADLGGTWQDWLANTFFLPERKAIEDALNDWTLKSITYTDVPPSGIYDGIPWFHTSYSDALCIGFSAWVAVRWRQDIAAEYTITVGNTASQAQHGLFEVEQSYNISHKAKTKGKSDDWQDFKKYKAPSGTLVYDSGGFGNDYEWIDSTQGNDSLPQLCAVQIAKTKILKSHRQNRISFECALNAGLDVDKTVRVEHAKLTAQGKVYSIQHTINVIEGFAVTKCTIAITLPSIAGQADASITRALMPYHTDPLDFAVPSAPTSFAALGQYLGNVDGAPEEDQQWAGLISNYQETWIGLGAPPPMYSPVRFNVETPALDPTDYNAWLNDEVELQTRLIKSGGSYYQRVEFGNETVVVGDTVKLYDGDTLKDTHTITTGELNTGYYQIAALNSRQDEHAVTHLITASYNVAIPVETLEISK